MDLMSTAQLLGNFGEFFGAVGVVATLAYLAVQVKETRKVAMAQAYQGRASMRQQGHILAADSNHLAPLLGRIRDLGWPENMSVIENLSAEERERIHEYVIQTLIHLDNVLYQQELGLVDRSLTDAVETAARAFAPTLQAIGRENALPPRIARLL